MANQEKSAAELYREERKKRIAKAAKSNSRKHISDKAQKRIVSTIAVILVIAIVGAIAGGIVNNKGVFERNKVIMTIGDAEVDKYEYAYYYSAMLQQYIPQAVQYEMYGMSIGCDFTKSLSEQAFIGELEGYENPTFADYFKKSAIDSIKYVKANIAYAAENNITLDEEDYKTIDEAFATIEENCKNEDGTSYSVAAYLRLSYGKGMTEKLFRRIMEEQTLAQKVVETKQEEFKAAYTDEDVEKAYNEGIDNYGYVTVRNYTFTIETAEEGAAATEDEIAAAKATAEDFAASITDEESFKKLASEHAKEIGSETAEDFLSDETLTLTENAPLSQYSTDEATYEWVKAAKAGETFVSTTDTDCTVYYMVDPLHKAEDTLTYDVRHILVKFPEADEEVTDGDVKEEVEVKEFDASAYDATVVNAVKDPVTDAESYNKAVDILTSYLEGDKTEDAFAALAVAHSEDGNAAQGGIYEDVAVGKMVSEFENWSLAEDRKVGDVGIVETTYGYHIMYHVGTNVTTWADTVKADLATADYDAFNAEITADDKLVVGEMDAEMSADIDALMDTTAKNYYKQCQDQMMASSYGY